MRPTKPICPGPLDDYDLLEQVGEGSMGVVYKARQRDSGQLVAIKVMPPQVAKNELLLKRFQQEFHITSRLDHPNLVRSLAYCDTGTSPYLVMEFVEGESLGDRLAREGRMSEQAAVAIISQAAQALHRAHKQGLIHRDIKPDNIMVTPDGQAKVLDLGLAKQIDATANLTHTGRGLGTPNFMAPEQFRDAKNAGVRCDVYSLAATLYQMVTGELPFASKDPIEIFMRKAKTDLPPPRRRAPDLSEHAERAIMRGLQADPNQRPASCREFVEELLGQTVRPPVGAEVKDSGVWPTKDMAPALDNHLKPAAAPEPPRSEERPAPVSAAPPAIAPDDIAEPPERLLDMQQVLILTGVAVATAVLAWFAIFR